MKSTRTPIAFASCAAGLSILASVATSQAAVVTDGLIAEYTFETGSTVDSVVGGIGDGVDVNNPTYTTTTGRAGTVLNLSPTNYVTIADPLALTPSGDASRSVSLWLSTEVYSREAGPFRSGVSGQNYQDFSLEYDRNSPDMKVNGWRADTPFDAVEPLSDWHNFTFSYDGPTNTTKVYIDGVEVADNVLGNALNTPQNGIQLGGPRRNGGTDNDASTMSIDDVLVYDRVLTLAEVEAIAGVPEPSGVLLSFVGFAGLFLRRRR